MDQQPVDSSGIGVGGAKAGGLGGRGPSAAQLQRGEQTQADAHQ